LVIAAPQTLHMTDMELFPNLRFISSLGAGYDHIDLQTAKKRNIIVVNVPQVHALAVAEMILAFIFSLAKRIAPFSQDLHSGVWQKEMCMTIEGKKLGIIGLGAIGKEIARLAHHMGMKLYASDVIYDTDFLKKYNIEAKSMEEILSLSDFVSLNVPLTLNTKHLIDRKRLALMKPTAYLINTSRGHVVDESALLEALNKKIIAGAALDVFSIEPPFQDALLNQIVNHPNVIVTPHIASRTPESRQAACQRIFQNILAIEEHRLDNLDRVDV
jgi:D-3-phosphoglycerate dehydrogenase